MTVLADDTRLTRCVEAAGTNVGDEVVILHLESGKYFGLDPVGTRIWDLLSEETTLAAICEQLQQEFDVMPEVLRADVRALLGSLLEHDIIRPA